ncbi:MAG: flagellar basal body L-ring protein FlgH [Sphingomonas fennica]
MRALLLSVCTLALVAAPAVARKKAPSVEWAPTAPAPLPAPAANGSIFQVSNGYAALTSGARAAAVGDILTIVLAERTAATKTNSATTDRNGSIGLTPPAAGPLALFGAPEASMSGGGTFKGVGNAAQSNQLNGEITVTVAQVLPNGTLVVRGEKIMNLNRGDEQIRISGLVRPQDVSFDNRVFSSRVGDAKIAYSGTGEIARASRQGWLNRFFSIVSPF